ncbi:MAG: hypothetical protein AAF391_04355, partial [Bacteroidota bacterium]
RNSETKKWYRWHNNTGKLLEVLTYETNELKEMNGRKFFGVHSITEDRLVLTKVIKSKNYSDKSAILFNVYFRK